MSDDARWPCGGSVCCLGAVLLRPRRRVVGSMLMAAHRCKIYCQALCRGPNLTKRLWWLHDDLVLFGILWRCTLEFCFVGLPGARTPISLFESQVTVRPEVLQAQFEHVTI